MERQGWNAEGCPDMKVAFRVICEYLEVMIEFSRSDMVKLSWGGDVSKFRE